ncbi:MAG TPA: DsbE family thiol:disulfide interchange protein [Steroidobacteraceae bacterium]|nr:DsbE family thiol:disulfide interchange protein [Steroidobacteraceae bacterium]
MKRYRFVVPLALFGLLVWVLAIGIKHSPDKGTIISPLLGKPAPQFSLPSLTDASRTVKSSDLRGRWYIFNVWGTWCGGCRQEHSVLLEMSRAGVVPIIGLDWKDNADEALSLLAQQGNPYEVVAVDKDGREAIDWGVYGAPETFLVNDQGIVVYKYIGPLTHEAWEKEFLPRLPRRQAAKS